MKVFTLSVLFKQATLYPDKTNKHTICYVNLLEKISPITNDIYIIFKKLIVLDLQPIPDTYL